MAQWPLFCIIPPDSDAFGANNVKVVEVRSILSMTKMQRKESSTGQYTGMIIAAFSETVEKESV